MASRGRGQRRHVGVVCSSSASQSGEGSLVRTGELRVVGCRILAAVLLMATKVDGKVCLDGDGEAAAASSLWTFGPPASSPLRWVVLRRHREACEVWLRSFLGSDLTPVQGSWIDGGRSGAGGPYLRLLLPDREVGASRLMVVHRFMSRRLTAGDSRFLKAWWCSSFQVWGRAAFFFSAGDAASRERRRVLWWLSFSAVAPVLRIRQCVCEPVYVCVLVCVPLCS